MNKEEANELLRFAIAVLQGKHGWISPHCRNNRLILAIDTKKRLKQNGFWWQARILGYWIHRFQRGDFNFYGAEGADPASRASGGGLTQLC